MLASKRECEVLRSKTLAAGDPRGHSLQPLLGSAARSGTTGNLWPFLKIASTSLDKRLAEESH